MLKALLFDLDGTLAETDSLHLLGWAELLEPYGYDVTETFYQEHMSGRIYPDVVNRLLPHISPDQRQAMVEAKESDFLLRSENLQPLPGTRKFIAEGRERGKKIALVTNATREGTHAVLDALGLEKAFDPIIVAGEVGSVKPDPLIYQTALETLRISACEALAFEDSPSGISSSVAAGIRTVGVASTHDPGKLASFGAEPVVADFTDPKLGLLLNCRGSAHSARETR